MFERSFAYKFRFQFQKFLFKFDCRSSCKLISKKCIKEDLIAAFFTSLKKCTVLIWKRFFLDIPVISSIERKMKAVFVVMFLMLGTAYGRSLPVNPSDISVEANGGNPVPLVRKARQFGKLRRHIHHLKFHFA